jgi:hypothetical protein
MCWHLTTCPLWPRGSKRFRSWLRRRYYKATGDAPSAAALNAALNLLEARAQFEALLLGADLLGARQRPLEAWPRGLLCLNACVPTIVFRYDLFLQTL